MYPVHADPIVSLGLSDIDISVGESFYVDVWADSDGIGINTYPYYYSLSFSFDISTTDFGYNGYTIASGFNDNSSGGNSIAGWKDEIYDI